MTTSRSLKQATMFAFVVSLGSLANAADGPAPRVIPLWPEGVPNAQPNGGVEREENERIFNVQSPSLTYFPAPTGTANGTAIVICPGGGYMRLAFNKEGSEFARLANSLGIAAFVLKYRLVEYGQPAPLQDVLRAVRLIRAQANEFGVNPDRIGVMGSSAGGHLAASAGTMFDAPEGRTGAELDGVSARPNFLTLLYPVITLKDPHAHAGSRQALLGGTPSTELVDRWSVDQQVTKNTPPTFLIHTAEDTSVPLENSLQFYAALRRFKIDSEMHIFEKGPHGFGTRADLGPTSAWPKRWEEWMRSHGWLDRP